MPRLTRARQLATVLCTVLLLNVVTMPNVAVGQCAGWLAGDAASATDASVTTIVQLPNGEVVVGGDFTQIGGVPANRVAKWNGSSWTPLGTGTNSRVAALAVMPNGDLIAGGSFSVAGGVTARGVARWDGVAWSGLGTQSNSDRQVNALAVMPNGDLIVAGSFTSFGGVAANHVVRWNGSAWSALGAGLNSFALAAKVAANGDLVVGGSFTFAGGQSAQRVARWNGSAWSNLGSGLNGYVFGLETLTNGDIIAGGEFTMTGALPASRIARWNGASWVAMGSGMSASSFPVVFEIAKRPTGEVVAVGQFTNAGGVSANQIANWNGSVWQPLGTGLAGNPPTAVAVASNGDILVGGSFSSAGGQVSACFARYSLTGVPTISVQPQAVSVSQGDDINLFAVPGRGYSNVSVAWKRDNAPIANGPGGASAGGGMVSGAVGLLLSPTTTAPVVLAVNDAQPSDSGVYEVVFTNACGSVTSAEVLVAVTPSCPACAADYDQDGGVTGADIGAFFADFESGATCADVDQNGGVDGGDLGYFFQVFEAGGC